MAFNTKNEYFCHWIHQFSGIVKDRTQPPKAANICVPLRFYTLIYSNKTVTITSQDCALPTF